MGEQKIEKRWINFLANHFGGEVIKANSSENWEPLRVPYHTDSIKGRPELYGLHQKPELLLPAEDMYRAGLNEKHTEVPEYKTEWGGIEQNITREHIDRRLKNLPEKALGLDALGVSVVRAGGEPAREEVRLLMRKCGW